MADYTLGAKVSADVSGFTSAMKTAQNSLAAFSSKCSSIGDTISKLGDKLSTIGTYATALETAVAGITATGIYEVTNAAVDWESAFAGVTKTVNGTDEELDAISEGIKQMATETASSSTEIAGVAEAAGQLGIATGDVLDFTKVMVELGDCTNLTAEEAASALAKMANITGLDSSEYEKLGSAIVDLGNNFATTESDIVQMSTRLASTATIVGISEQDILGLATAMSSVGIEAEAGGSSMSTVLKKMQSYCSTGGEQLDTLAGVAGMTADEFKTAFEEDAAGALEAFITGLGDVQDSGGDALSILSALDLTDIRVSNTVLALASGSDTLSSALDTANTAWEENTALSKEASTRYATTASAMSQAKESVSNLAIAIGEKFTPYVRTACTMIKTLASAMETGFTSGGFEGAIESAINCLDGLANASIIPRWVADLADELPAKIESIKENLETLGDQISKIANSFGIELDGGWLTGLTGIAATGPGLMVVGKALSGFGSVVSIFGTLAGSGGTLAGVLVVLVTAAGAVSAALQDSGLQSALSWLVDSFGNFVTTLGEFLFSSDGVVSTLGEGLAPVLETLVYWVSSSLDGFTAMMDFLSEHQSLLAAVTDAIAALVVGIIAWKVAMAAYNVVQAMTNATLFACPLVWIVAAIAAVIAIIVLLWNNCDGFRNFVLKLWDTIKTVAAAVKNAVSVAVNAIITFFKNLAAKVKEIVSNIAACWKSGVETIREAVHNVVEKIKSIWESITTTVSNVFNRIKSTITTILDKIKTTFTNVIDQIKAAWNGITDFVGGIFDGIQDSFQSVVDWLKGFINGFIDNINSVIGVLNKIPGVSISEISYLANGTDNWQGGFAIINESGRGELVNLPDGSQVIPHDLSEKYATEAARANSGVGVIGIDYEALAAAVMSGMCGADVRVTTQLDGKTVADQITPFVDRNLGRRQAAAARG